ncbi:MAG: type II toxin-antitoxin system RelE/ParE family toxin [Acidobacteria bacterium]|nr:type II toxin-antitoxin system RelE/ParE family toxin [Acidobacteriota bacterium]
MRVRVLVSARRTVADGIRFYESQQLGLGAYFLNSIMSDLRSLGIYAGIHQKHFGSYHRMICSKFPFSIYYRKDGEEVSVLAILDDRRDPNWIKGELRKATE